MKQEKSLHSLRKKQVMATRAKHIVIVILLLFILYPVLLVVLNSFKTEAQLYANPLGLPTSLDLTNYKDAIVDGNLINAFFVSLFLTVSSVLITTILGSFAAFAFTRRELKLSKPLYFLFVLGIMIPYQVGIYQLYKIVDNLNLVNNLLGLMLIYIAWSLPFTVFVMYGFFRELPKEIEEAARIDGCSTFKLYAKIVMPLSVSVVTATVIFNMMFVWNDMFFPLIFVDSQNLKPLSNALLAFKGQFMSRNTVMFAGVVIVSLPMIVTYLLLQKKFIQGLTAGSVKG